MRAGSFEHAPVGSELEFGAVKRRQCGRLCLAGGGIGLTDNCRI